MHHIRVHHTTMHHITIHHINEGRWLRAVMTKGGDWVRWWLREVVMTQGGDWGKRWLQKMTKDGLAGRSEMAAWLLSGFVAMCVETCGLDTWCCKTNYNGCMTVAWGLSWGGSRARNHVFFRVKWLQAPMEGILCVRLRFGPFRT